jgi:hypothetical protein
MSRQIAGILAIALLTVCSTSTAPARAQTVASITPTLVPDRPGAGSALTIAIRYAGGDLGVPEPVRRTVIQFPSGMTLDLPQIHTCSPERLRTLGADGCPADSRVGSGHALLAAREGSQTIDEDATLTAFLGPAHNLEPTLEILGQGYTPFDERVVLIGSELPDRAPYGEEIEMIIPPIPTLPLEPDASMLTFSLTVGTRGHRADANTVVVPSRCPAGGFPFAADFTYADGSTSSAAATTPCPPADRVAHVASTVSLDVSARLHATSKHNLTLYEQGQAAGTVTGTIYVHLTVVSTSRVTAEVRLYPDGGSIVGLASADYRRGSETASFSGAMSISGGTGRFQHARGSGLSFSGTIQRSNDAVTVHVSGRVSD